MPKAPIEPIYAQLGEKIAKFRLALGLSCAEFGKVIGVGANTVRSMERGGHRIYLHHLEAMTKPFHTTPGHLLKGIWL